MGLGNKHLYTLVLLLVVAMVVVETDFYQEGNTENVQTELENPENTGNMTVENALKERRSVRNFRNHPLTLKEITQLLWAAQGITSENGYRTAPSAGALYPLTIHVVAENVKGLEKGIYRYLPEENKLEKTRNGSFRDKIYRNALRQTAVKEASALLIITGDYSVTRKKYGDRAERYVHLEAGHAGQNIYLQAETLGLGTVSIGAFSDRGIKQVLNTDSQPLYIFPVGRK